MVYFDKGIFTAIKMNKYQHGKNFKNVKWNKQVEKDKYNRIPSI